MATNKHTNTHTHTHTHTHTDTHTNTNTHGNTRATRDGNTRAKVLWKHHITVKLRFLPNSHRCTTYRYEMRSQSGQSQVRSAHLKTFVLPQLVNHGKVGGAHQQARNRETQPDQGTISGKQPTYNRNRENNRRSPSAWSRGPTPEEEVSQTRVHLVYP